MNPCRTNRCRMTGWQDSRRLFLLCLLLLGLALLGGCASHGQRNSGPTVAAWKDKRLAVEVLYPSEWHEDTPVRYAAPATIPMYDVERGVMDSVLPILNDLAPEEFELFADGKADYLLRATIQPATRNGPAYGESRPWTSLFFTLLTPLHSYELDHDFHVRYGVHFAFVREPVSGSAADATPESAQSYVSDESRVITLPHGMFADKDKYRDHAVALFQPDFISHAKAFFDYARSQALAAAKDANP